MKNDKLHQSEESAKHFAHYRDEAPLLSTIQVDKLLADRDMLPNRSTKSINVRRIIMTLSGITGLAAIAYFALFASNNGSNVIDKSHATYSSHEIVQEQKTLSNIDSSSQQHSVATHASQKNDTHGPWSAGNDQYYADLTPVELRKLGIIIQGDTIVNYKLDKKYGVEIGKVAAHYIQGMGMTSSLPAGIEAHHFYPELITFANGNGAAWRTDSSCGMIASEINTLLLPWLKKSGTPGIHALGFTNHRAYNGVGYDTLRLQIGKNFSQPAPFPFAWYNIDPHWDSVKDEVMELAHYFEGAAPKPSVELPMNFTLAVDTVTPQDLLDQFAQEQNGTDMEHLRSIMARLNELVPVIVRINPEKGAPGDKDFILWYEPSEELFAALPPTQANAFRAKLAEPPHCFTSPNAVLSTAEITYCVSKTQTVEFFVRDLTGKLLISSGDDAVAGDNVWNFSTETLPSGMYLVTVREADGSERTRRIWVENAHPKTNEEEMDETVNQALKNGMPVSDLRRGARRNESKNSQVGLPVIPMFEPSNDSEYYRLGIESDEFQARFYERSPWNPAKVLSIGIQRAGGCLIQNIDTQFVKDIVPVFHPLFVTDGIGGKRAISGDSSITLFADNGYDNINALIPVLLRKESASGQIGVTDIIFWYKPTSEFLVALPDSARTVAKQMNGSNGNNSASVEAIHGAISKAIVYPNPSKGKLSIDITMGAPRTLKFTLRNLLGQQVALPVTAHSEGETTQQLDFGSAGEGVYLLDITSDSGERFVQRIVIAR